MSDLTPGPSPDDSRFVVGRGENAAIAGVSPPLPKRAVPLRERGAGGEAQRVECHSGYEYAERPTAVWWQGQRFEVAEIESRWRIPGGRCFRVRTGEGLVFNLTYAELYDEWRVHQL